MRRLLLWLARLFPAPFRDQFGAELDEHIRRDYDDARRVGVFAAAWFTLATTVDLARSILAERLNPSLAAPIATTRDEMDSMFGNWGRDIRHAARALRRAPGFAAVAIGTLGLAIGVNAGMFSVVKTVLIDSLALPAPDRLVSVAGTAPGSDMPPWFGLGDEFYVQFREQSKLIADVAVMQRGTSTLRVGDRVERVVMSFHSWNLFNTLQVKPALGRLPTAQDSNVAVISYAVWKTWFGGDSSIIGKTYSISYADRQVIGVMGPEFIFPSDRTLVWVPSPISATRVQAGRFGNDMVARMKPGATAEAVASELTALSKPLPERFGGSANYAKVISQLHVRVEPLDEVMVGRTVRRSLWVLFASVGIVLLIACANVANLFMVRSEGRRREMALRQAIGASRLQLVRLQLAESVVVAGAAAVLALVFARVTLPLMIRAAPPGVERLGMSGVGLATILFTVAAAVVVALACGLVPALRASAPDLSRLREGGRGSTRRTIWARDTLVVAQTALALVLLIASGLLLRSHARLSEVKRGYDTKDLFTFQFAPEQQRLRDGPGWAAFHLDFMERLKALPGVQSVGIVENIPLDEGTRGGRFRTEEQAGDPNAGAPLQFTFAGPEYFKTIGIGVLAGRPFNREDNVSTLGNVVISKSAAKKLFGTQDPIGRRVQLDGLVRDNPTWETVIGVVDDVLQNDLRDTPQATVYFPLTGQRPDMWRLSSPGYVVKTTRAETIGPEILALIHQVAPEAPMYRTFTMDFLARRSMVQLSFTMLTLGIVATLALILGAIGLYGVLSYVVAERTREIGVRMALGAEAGQVRRMVVAQGARVVGLGAVIGVLVALASTTTLGSLLFNVPPKDIATFVSMSVMLLAVGLLASYVPARRASNVDPIESLRGD